MFRYDRKSSSMGKVTEANAQFVHSTVVMMEHVELIALVVEAILHKRQFRIHCLEDGIGKWASHVDG